MTRDEAFEKVNEICRDVFDDEDIKVGEDTTAADIEDWDSLTHLMLVSEIEKGFGIKFTMGEIQNFANVGEMVSSIIRHSEGK